MDPSSAVPHPSGLVEIVEMRLADPISPDRIDVRVRGSSVHACQSQKWLLWSPEEFALP
jgi:hypothetical protein